MQSNPKTYYQPMFLSSFSLSIFTI